MENIPYAVVIIKLHLCNNFFFLLFSFSFIFLFLLLVIKVFRPCIGINFMVPEREIMIELFFQAVLYHNLGIFSTLYIYAQFRGVSLQAHVQEWRKCECLIIFLCLLLWAEHWRIEEILCRECNMRVLIFISLLTPCKPSNILSNQSNKAHSSFVNPHLPPRRVFQASTYCENLISCPRWFGGTYTVGSPSLSFFPFFVFNQICDDLVAEVDGRCKQGHVGASSLQVGWSGSFTNCYSLDILFCWTWGLGH